MPADISSNRRTPTPITPLAARDQRGPSRVVIHALFFLSGATGLVFEVLWLRGLGLLFGNTAYAAAATLSVFFLGLAAGARVWGARSHRYPNPLRSYALLECGVALTALLYLGLLKGYHFAYAALVGALGYGALLTMAKLLLAAAALFPPAFLMGGTLPLLAEHLVRDRNQLGRTGSLLYAVNTAGAAFGALLAGFWLPRLFGFAASYGGALATVLFIAATAFALSAGAARSLGGNTQAAPSPELVPNGSSDVASFGMRAIMAVAFLSGFATLGLEVLWTRLLAQVLNNSVYAFAAILVTFLAALGGGALLAHQLSRARAGPRTALGVLAGLSAIAVVLTTLLFVRATQGLSYLATDGTWGSYVRGIFTAAALLIFLPGTLMGAILPLLFRAMQRWQRGPGVALGRLAAMNSLGAIIGSLGAGFVLLDMVGLWWSVVVMATVYAGIASYALFGGYARTPLRSVMPLLLPLAVLAAGTMKFPTVRLRSGEKIEWLREGSGATVSVVRDGDNLVMRMNNHYVLGDTRSLAVQRLQGHLPLLLHPAPRDVFFLGLGTGIMAGAALDHPVQRLVVAELVPEVVAASQARFEPYANGLFRDPRARIVVEDGRSYLAGTRQRYDVIVGDLFTPWHAGTGSLYTVEHFRTVRSRLQRGGIFAQWLPLHQLSEPEFMIIVRTMREVFPQVTLWRGDFSPSRPIVALVAQREGAPLDNAMLARNTARMSSATARIGPGSTSTAAGQHMAGLFYAGNLGWAGASSGYPLNTDDRPTIEYRFHRADFEPAARLTGATLARLYEQLLARVPPASDPVLGRLPATEIPFVDAGLAFYKYHLYSEAGRADSADFFLRQFLAVVPTSSGPPFSGAGVGVGSAPRATPAPSERLP